MFWGNLFVTDTYPLQKLVCNGYSYCSYVADKCYRGPWRTIGNPSFQNYRGWFMKGLGIGAATTAFLPRTDGLFRIPT
jgi:hypothetical protein